MRAPSPAVGVAYVGNGPPEAVWSGVPSGVARGLGELGYDPVLFNAELPRPLARAAKSWGRLVTGNRAAGQLAPAVSRLRTSLAGRRSRSVDDVPLWVLCGRAISEAPSFGPGLEVTYADMTVTQAVAHDIEGFAALPEAVAEAMRQRQQRRHSSALACCVGSQWAAESLVADYGIDRQKVHVVGFGRNVEPTIVERDWSTPRFLFVGKDWRRKNGETVVRAFQTLRREVPAATLDLVGDHPSLDVEGVVCHGMLSMSTPAENDRIRVLFEQATCFVMPSRHEAFGIAYVEAAAAGLPCIGTTNGGAASAVGEGGVLVDPRDERDLVAAMRLLSDPARAAALGRLAYEHARGFSWREVTARILRAAGRTPDVPVRTTA